MTSLDLGIARQIEQLRNLKKIEHIDGYCVVCVLGAGYSVSVAILVSIQQKYWLKGQVYCSLLPSKSNVVRSRPWLVL